MRLHLTSSLSTNKKCVKEFMIVQALQVCSWNIRILRIIFKLGAWAPTVPSWNIRFSRIIRNFFILGLNSSVSWNVRIFLGRCALKFHFLKYKENLSRENIRNVILLGLKNSIFRNIRKNFYEKISEIFYFFIFEDWAGKCVREPYT